MRHLLVLSILVLSFSLTASGATYVVDPFGTGDYPTIQAAVTASSPGDIVELTDGVFTGPGNRGVNYGTKAITVRSQSGNPETCIVDCESADEGFLFWTGTGPGSVLDGVTVTNGYHANWGGGIRCFGASPTVNNCVFVGNSPGGASIRYGSDATITDCTFTENASYGMLLVSASPTIDGCTFSDNANPVSGGGIECQGECYAVLTNCVFSGNSSNQDGGGMRCVADASPSLTDCMFVGNVAEQEGGGLYCYLNSSPTLTRCVFSGNSAGGYGGGGALHFANETAPMLLDCVLTGNTSATVGGAVSTFSSSPTFANCLFFENEADAGGAIACRDGAPVLTHCTLAANSAVSGSGVSASYSAAPVLENTIIAFGVNGAAVYCGAVASATLACCDVFGNDGGDWEGCIADQYGVAGNIELNPFFCDAAAGDFTLCSDSPCAEDNYPECGQVGARPVGCDACGQSATEPATWGGVKGRYR